MIYTFKRKLTLHERELLKKKSFPTIFNLACNSIYSCDIVSPGPFDFDRSINVKIINKITNATSICTVGEGIIGDYTVEIDKDIINLTLS